MAHSTSPRTTCGSSLHSYPEPPRGNKLSPSRSTHAESYLKFCRSLVRYQIYSTWRQKQSIYTWCVRSHKLHHQGRTAFLDPAHPSAYSSASRRLRIEPRISLSGALRSCPFLSSGRLVGFLLCKSRYAHRPLSCIRSTCPCRRT